MAALLDHGWSEHGPTDSNLITIYHKSSVYPIFRSNVRTVIMTNYKKQQQ